MITRARMAAVHGECTAAKLFDGVFVSLTPDGERFAFWRSSECVAWSLQRNDNSADVEDMHGLTAWWRWEIYARPN